MADVVPAPRIIKGRFQPGRSGNPAGRPKGSRNKVTLVRLALEGELITTLGPHMTDILMVAIDKAKAGNEAMIKLLVDKAIPTHRPTDEETSETPRINIQIGRLPDRESEPIPIKGEVIEHERG